MPLSILNMPIDRNWNVWPGGHQVQLLGEALLGSSIYEKKKKKKTTRMFDLYMRRIFFLLNRSNMLIAGGVTLFLYRGLMCQLVVIGTFNLGPNRANFEGNPVCISNLWKKSDKQKIWFAYKKNPFFFTPFFPFFCILVKHADCHFDVFHLFYTGTNVPTAISWNI